MMARLVLVALLLAAAPPRAEAASPAPAGKEQYRVFLGSPPPDFLAPSALSCSGCHPTGKSVDTPVPGLAGRNPAEIEAAMLAFRSGQRPASVMNRIAKGFSDDEIKAIAAWFGAQK